MLIEINNQLSVALFPQRRLSSDRKSEKAIVNFGKIRDC
jgi:hypothetical protein